MAFFKDWFGSKTKAGKETLLLIINLDEKYCDPRITGNLQTQEAAKRIKKLAGEFRKAGATVCATYVAELPRMPKDLRFSEYRPSGNDILICNTAKDGLILNDPALTEKIKAVDIRNIFVCGTSFNTAVSAHALAAREQGFNVSVLSDMTGNDNTETVQSVSVRDVISNLRKKGVSLETASFVLQSLKR